MPHLVDRLSRRQKQVILVLMDTGIFAGALYLAFLLRLDDRAMASTGAFWGMFVAVVATRVPIFIKLGLYRAVLRYPSRQLILTIFRGVALSALLISAVLYLLRVEFLARGVVPRAVVFIEPLISCVAVIASREFLAYLLARFLGQDDEQPVLIYGAGVAGMQLAQALALEGSMRPVAFVDDEPSKWGARMVDLDVRSPDQVPRLVHRYGIRVALVAAPATDAEHRRRMVERLEAAGLEVKEVPGVLDLVRGRSQIAELATVKSSDLLGRGVVDPDDELLQKVVPGRSVLVTGAGGSIGSEICRQVAALGPARLVLYEINEYALYRVEMELAEAFPGLKVAAVLGSVLDERRLEETYRRFAVDSVYHAAAYKHVPLVEQNPVEGVRNNVFGTLTAARAAVHCGVGTFLLVSTDKAVRPCNVMGASKRVAELACLMLGTQARGSRVLRPGVAEPTRFSIVRFGNVLDSAGSVVPLFRKQIAAGGPVTVTHPDVQRYFMTIPEAAQLVVQASAMGEGGEVFLLDMGEPVRVLELAERMIELATANAHRSIPIEFTGLRPGEKLVEELLVDPERSRPTAHPKIYRAVEDGLGAEVVAAALVRMEDAMERGALALVYGLLAELVEGYEEPPEARDVLHRGGTAFSFRRVGALPRVAAKATVAE